MKTSHWQIDNCFIYLFHGYCFVLYHDCSNSIFTISSKYHEYFFCMWLSWLIIKSSNPPLFVLIDMPCNRYGADKLLSFVPHLFHVCICHFQNEIKSVSCRVVSCRAVSCRVVSCRVVLCNFSLSSYTWQLISMQIRARIKRNLLIEILNHIQKNKLIDAVHICVFLK